MSIMSRFLEYAADFEKTFEDDDWTRLKGYFAVFYPVDYVV